TVLYLEGDRYHDLRLLRGVKNRFGSTQEVGIFEMTEAGLKEVSNPSQMLLKHRPNNPIGSCLTVTLEGTRPLLVEIQALTHTTAFGYPKRAASGFDLTRLELLIAVLQKHAGLNLGNQDVYVNVVGGLKIKDPSVDLAVCLAIASSFYKKPLAQDLTAFGEIGLSGEIREGNQHKKRLHEAKQWSSQILVPGKINTLKEMLGMI
ncbi:MAG: magnesium chelatase domain-containing protein, partial [Candidatus Gracilibacteria bacterium]